MKYETRVKIRVGFSMAVAVVGIGTVVTAILGGKEFLQMRSWYIGSGMGLLGAGIALAVKNILLLNNSEKMEQARVREEDERNLYLRDKAMALSGYLTIGVLYSCTLIFGVVNPMVAQVLLLVLCGYLIAMCVIYWMIRRIA